ncbi:unnamed protein product [Cuscuta campestris]|uniref:Uncharacterized protein n=1 Tax=Cuscuta campestris TaxID=132261 RepID=A0A484MWK2_9ASTE|nr:unnamed protein product [Cuscuta campestris]
MEDLHLYEHISGLGANRSDQAIWKPKSNGLFTLKAAKHFLDCSGHASVQHQKSHFQFCCLFFYLIMQSNVSGDTENLDCG